MGHALIVIMRLWWRRGGTGVADQIHTPSIYHTTLYVCNADWLCMSSHSEKEIRIATGCPWIRDVIRHRHTNLTSLSKKAFYGSMVKKQQQLKRLDRTFDLNHAHYLPPHFGPCIFVIIHYATKPFLWCKLPTPFPRLLFTYSGAFLSSPILDLKIMADAQVMGKSVGIFQWFWQRGKCTPFDTYKHHSAIYLLMRYVYDAIIYHQPPYFSCSYTLHI